MDNAESIFLEYQKTIPGKLDRLKRLIQTLKDNQSLENLKQLQMEVHKIAGNSGTYGFMNASDLCKALDQDLLEKMKNFPHSSLDNEYLNSLDTFLKSLEKAFIKPEKKLKF